MTPVNPSMAAAIHAAAAAATSAEPSWAETTVRWLRAKRPEYLRTSVAESAIYQLSRALMRMSFFKLTSDDAGASSTEYSNLCTEAAKLWVKADHDELVAWLAKGGYAAERRERDAAVKEMTADEDDHVALATTKEEVEQAIGELKAPQIEITLEEILADAERDSVNPEHGSW